MKPDLPPLETPPLPYRSGVGVMLLNCHNQVFVARRLDTPSSRFWQMPQGGLEEGETPQQGALRELHEEIGTKQAAIIAEAPQWLSYDFPEELIPTLWQGKYRGQRQKWFAMRFQGQDTEINIHTHQPEFRAWKWAPMTELPDLIVPFKRALYQELVAVFAPLVTATP